MGSGSGRAFVCVGGVFVFVFVLSVRDVDVACSRRRDAGRRRRWRSWRLPRRARLAAECWAVAICWAMRGAMLLAR
eukprot:COSAG02_NODE_516_length_20804_cov_162.717460_3_plen_76_part_00